MEEIMEGDRVKRIGSDFCEAVVGGIYTVARLNGDNSYSLKGLKGSYSRDSFKKVSIYQIY